MPLTTVSPGVMDTQATATWRNRIINGGMGIWQRGTSGFTTLGNYSADRWFVNAGTSLSAVSRSTDVPAGFQFSISVAGTNVPQVVQRIESLNSFDLVGQSVTISFWAKQTSGAGSNSLFLQLLNPNATDNYVAVTQIGGNVFFTGTSGWVQYSTTFNNLPAGAANGLQVIIGANTLGAATFLVTGVQLEAGTAATAFERRDYGRELMLCQRYAEAINLQLVSHVLTLNNIQYAHIFFKQTKRAAPTYSVLSGSWEGITPTTAAINTQMVRLDANSSTAFYSNGSATILISSEL